MIKKVQLFKILPFKLKIKYYIPKKKSALKLISKVLRLQGRLRKKKRWGKKERVRVGGWRKDIQRDGKTEREIDRQTDRLK